MGIRGKLGFQPHHGAILTVRSWIAAIFLIAIRFWILWFMRVLHGGGTDHGCTAATTSWSYADGGSSVGGIVVYP
jgi:hypothetical protein